MQENTILSNNNSYDTQQRLLPQSSVSACNSVYVCDCLSRFKYAKWTGCKNFSGILRHVHIS